MGWVLWLLLLFVAFKLLVAFVLLGGLPYLLFGPFLIGFAAIYASWVYMFFKWLWRIIPVAITKLRPALKQVDSYFWDEDIL
jgi:hypothetical protein